MKDTIKILVYPNITYQKDLERDSYIVVIHNVIECLNKIRKDLHFTLWLPELMNYLNFPNVDQKILPMPSYPNSMRTHFNFDEVMALVDWKRDDYDIVYSHLPEHTSQLKNLFVNTTNIDPMFIGYCHWFEVPENTAYRANLFPENLLGILNMSECGVNTQWLKDLIVDKSADYFNAQVQNDLDDIIKPHYLGIDRVDMKSRKYEKGSIVFNHRANDYTGWTWFLECMDELYETRDDFTVYVTVAPVERDYIKKVSISDRDGYLEWLSTMHMGVGCFKKYSAWSISTTDGLGMGVPYILPDGLCYPEMVGDDYPLLHDSREEFINLVSRMLNEEGLRSYVRDAHLKPLAKELTWQGRVARWFQGWQVFKDLKKDKGCQGSKRYADIVKFIRQKGYVTKEQILKHMNWAVRIFFTGYRNRLRQEKDIILHPYGYGIKGADIPKWKPPIIPKTGGLGLG